MHISLVAGRKTRGYIRYSLLLFPLLFCLIGRCSRRWSTGAGDPRCRPPQREDPRGLLRRRVPPLTRSSVEVPRQEASPFRSCCVCASLLKATLFSGVCTQIPLLPLTLCSRAVVFDPSWPLACNIKLVFLFIELCCDYLTVSP